MSENVKSAVRTLRMLELFANEQKPLTLKQITTYLEMPKSSAFMLLNTLIREHYIEEIGSGQFTLANTLKGAGNWLGGIIEVIRTEAIKEMDNLISVFGESVVLGCLTTNNNVRIVSARQSTREMGYIVAQNPTIPSWCSCMGHAILANMPEDKVLNYLKKSDLKKLTDQTVTDPKKIINKLKKWRSLGYAVNINERIDGASGVAVPIFDSNGWPQASLNIVMLTPRFHQCKEEVISELQNSARRIEKAIFLPQRNTIMEPDKWLIA